MRNDGVGSWIARRARRTPGRIPKSVRFTGELPRTGTGKILKKRLRETHGDA